MIESLQEKFNIKHLDVTTRTYAAVYIEGKIYFDKTHIAAINKFEKETHNKNEFLNLKHATLHVICNNKNSFFIENNNLLTNVDTDLIIKQIKKQYPKQFEVYLYTFKDKIELIKDSN